MPNCMKKIITLFFVSILMIGNVFAQVKTTEDGVTIDKAIKLDKIVHDFGDVMVDAGPLTCEFTVTNISDRALVIYNVSISCGCTEVDWTREPIYPDETGTITVVYANTDGPYPFDKNVTVYFSGIKKPVVLKLRGVGREKEVPIAEKFPIHLGGLGLKEVKIKGGNVTQGSQKSDFFTVANVSKSPINLKFEDLSQGLEIISDSSSIPVGETSNVRFTVTSSRSKWGRNWYYATPVVNGKKQSPIAIWVYTREDFSSWSQAQKNQAAQPVFNTNTHNFGNVKAGTIVEAQFSCKNTGKSDFVVYKIDSDWDDTVIAQYSDIQPGKTGVYKFSVDTSKMPEGESMVIITLTTNTPNRPMVNLFIGGAVKK